MRDTRVTGNLLILPCTVRAQSTYSWGTTLKTLGHRWGVKLLGAQWRQKQLGHCWGTFGAHISLGHSWGRVKVNVSLKVRNYKLPLLLIEILCPKRDQRRCVPQCTPICAFDCAQINFFLFCPEIVLNCAPIGFALTVPQLCRVTQGWHNSDATVMPVCDTTVRSCLQRDGTLRLLMRVWCAACYVVGLL